MEAWIEEQLQLVPLDDELAQSGKRCRVGLHTTHGDWSSFTVVGAFKRAEFRVIYPEPQVGRVLVDVEQLGEPDYRRLFMAACHFVRAMNATWLTLGELADGTNIPADLQFWNRWERIAAIPNPGTVVRLYQQKGWLVGQYENMMSVRDKPRVSWAGIFYEMAKRSLRQMYPNLGWIYVISEPQGTYKIGRTKNIKDRLRTHGVKLPFPIEYVHTLTTTNHAALEDILHDYFEDKHVAGEWYALTSEDVAAIKTFAHVDDPYSVPDQLNKLLRGNTNAS